MNMKQLVTLKGNKYGLLLRLDPEAAFADVIQELAVKLQASADFFKDAKMALSVEGRKLCPQEEDAILETVKNHCQIEVICMIDSDEQREQLYKRLVEQAVQAEAAPPVAAAATGKTSGETEAAKGEFPAPDEAAPEVEASQPKEGVVPDVQNLDINTGQFYKGTLRSGQVIESAGNLIVLGDINPGGKAIAAGNIIVLGSLKGYAVAGAGGNETAFVVALEMLPMQIRIGNIIGRSIDKKKKRGKTQPKIAFVLNKSIYIEDINREIMNDIHYE